MSFHKLDKAKDKRFWSVRVSSDLRLIVHRTTDSLLLCYVDHHDKAYAWAERRKLETHPTTGAAQLVEIRETVQEIVVPAYVAGRLPAPAPKKPLLRARARRGAARLRRAGRVAGRRAAGDRGHACSRWRTTCRRRPPRRCSSWRPAGRRAGAVAAPAAADPFEHPDAQRRFRVVSDVEELARALEYPVGAVDGLPAPRAARAGRARLRRAGARRRLGRHGQDRSSRCTARRIWPAPTPTRACS